MRKDIVLQMMTEKITCQEARLILRVDGAARGNPGHAGIGGTISNESGHEHLSFNEYIGKATNNVAEYSALIFGLREAAKLKSNSIIIYSDSELLVQQLNGFYKVKNAGLKPLFKEAKRLLSSYIGVTISHIPREENSEADKLANQAIEDYLSGEKRITKLGIASGQESLF